MANALDLLLQKREQQARTEEFQASLINQTFNSLVQSQQQERKNALDLLSTRASLAKSGLDLKFDENGKIDFLKRQDLSGSDDIIRQLKDVKEIRDLAVSSRNKTLLDATNSTLSNLLGDGEKNVENVIDKSSVELGHTDINSENIKFQTDPFTGKLTPFGQIQLDAAKTVEREKQKLNLKREDLKNTLAPILAVESTIPRSEEGGIPRFKQGAKNKISGFLQSGVIGENISNYEDWVDQVTPKIARASGDVANIAVAERQFAKKAFPGVTETKGSAAKKRAFLVDFTKAIDSNNPSEVKKLLDSQGLPYFDLEQNKWINLLEQNPPNLGDKASGKLKEFNSPQEADNSGLPQGTIVLVQNRRYQI